MNKLLLVVFGSALLSLFSVPVQADSIVGDFRIYYRFNASGCQPPGYPNITPADGNPYFCPSGIPPGPYFINAQP